MRINVAHLAGCSSFAVVLLSLPPKREFLRVTITVE